MFGKRETLYKIKALDTAKTQIRRVTYSRVSDKILSKRKIQRLWKLANAKKKPKILEDDEWLVFQYEKKPLIIIKKDNGKLYSLKRPDKWIRHQAYIMLAILDSFGLVDNYKRKTVYKKGLKLWGKGHAKAT